MSGNQHDGGEGGQLNIFEIARNSVFTISSAISIQEGQEITYCQRLVVLVWIGGVSKIAI